KEEPDVHPAETSRSDLATRRRSIEQVLSLVPEPPPREDVAKLAARRDRTERLVDGARQIPIRRAQRDRIHTLAHLGDLLQRRPRHAVPRGDDVIEDDAVDASLLEIEVRLLDALVQHHF